MRPYFVLIFACSLFAGCAGFEKTYTDDQRREVRSAENLVIENIESIRSRLDSQDKRGALIFIDVPKKTLPIFLFGDTPLEAWLTYVKSLNLTDTTKLPLPSEVSRESAFIYSIKYLGKNEIFLNSTFDGEVLLYYDLLRSMSRIGGDIQDLRDITILLAESDKRQVENTKKLTNSFDGLSARMSNATNQLEKLTTLQESTRSQLMQSLSDLKRDLERIERLIGAMR
ncbi:hypothetical protein [Ottowia sp.]|uniref:hypothetical protein n=1 Tax=Ottowia sp. TaxID=1898956 RepID=UPI0026309A19|nr:hypothetical protein [Ottowia sp.]